MEVMEYYHKSRDLMRQQDYDAVIELCTGGLAEHPDSCMILERRAVAYEYKKEHHKAIADYTRVIALKPQDPDGWNSRGNLYHNLGEYDKAIADYTQCIPLSPPGYGTYWSNRGISYSEKGDLDAAIADLTTSIETWSTEDCTCWALLHRGLVWRKKGDLKKALADFRKSAAREPYRKIAGDQALYNAGYIWFLRGNPEKALPYFSRAIKRRDDCADYWLARGVCYWNICVRNRSNFWNDDGETMNLAEEDFGKAIECNPAMTDAYLDRATVRCAKATDSYNFIKAILAGKAVDETQRVLLMAQLEHIGGHDMVPQFDALLRGLRSSRDEAEEIMAKSLVLFVHHDAGEALEDLDRVLELDPNLAEAWYQRGMAHALLGKPDQALEDYDRALALNPDHDRAAKKRNELLSNG